MINDGFRQQHQLLSAFGEGESMTKDQIRAKMSDSGRSAVVDFPVPFNRAVDRAISDELIQRKTPSTLAITDKGRKVRSFED
ncbi:hypothetical protein [Neorhizobium galegae]|uniref:hypothetical protein n=1 Tax=Neorhizobium galegae TaxID=399 RepID=UPI000622511F|nr:hypothetical protein [Neorhizobium galegae]CDZ55401.1 Hypothetical protein NGAL_HAMBI2427_62050 [Neorhizobium galegae bv. orientalis]